MVESFLSVLAQSNGSSGGGAAGMICGCIMMLIYLAIIVLVIAGFWKTFDKAGQPGWAAIVPIYNIYIWRKIVGRPGWWVLLMFIPFVSLIFLIILGIDLAKAFGKGAGFGVGIGLLPFIFVPMIGFGDAQYQGPSAA